MRGLWLSKPISPASGCNLGRLLENAREGRGTTSGPSRGKTLAETRFVGIFQLEKSGAYTNGNADREAPRQKTPISLGTSRSIG
ncbi:hypothetical protein NDU88_006510 [Pleurodeles waltl]|uniref:Uncharacterized protein n=1 Tax=Pleurodeles waltl TaxID=8319 RepID=A0AAV7LSS5_PLEWA|nr:hypothetical protein NDU88_006510 [Pleurodeles waltl]